MTKFEKDKAAFLQRISFTHAWKPSGDLINFCLQGYLFELSPEAKAFMKQKDIIGKEIKRIQNIA